MDGRKIAQAAPYVVVLIVAGALYAVAGGITYDARPGQLGPDSWPRAILVLMALACVYEIARIALLRSPREEVDAIAEALDHEKIEESKAEQPVHRRLLLAGAALTAGYAVLVPLLGFLLATFLYLVAFIYVGRYRRHAVIWASSLLGTLLFAFVFLKVVYVSLPRGTPPFDQVTQLVMDLLGVR